MEGSGSVQINYGSGCGSRRPKNKRMNTVQDTYMKYANCKLHSFGPRFRSTKAIPYPSSEPVPLNLQNLGKTEVYPHYITGITWFLWAQDTTDSLKKKKIRLKNVSYLEEKVPDQDSDAD